MEKGNYDFTLFVCNFKLFTCWPEETSSGAVCPHQSSLRDGFCYLLERDRNVGSIPTDTELE